jgi:hypothetical protein
MPTTPPHRTLRSAAVAAALLTATFAAPAGAVAAGPPTAGPPTLGPPTVIAAGQKSPIDVGGNHLRQGDTIARGTQLVRWAVTMHGASKAPVTLSCPGSLVESGFSQQEGSQIYASTAKGSRFYERTLDVTFRAAPKIDPSSAHGQVYLLCRDRKVAPLHGGMTYPMPPMAVRRAGQRSPVAVPGAHLKRGAKIAKGMQLVRWGVVLFDARQHVFTVTCPRGTAVRGIGMAQGAQVIGGTLFSRPGRNTVKAAFQRAPSAHHNEATASVYLACSAR